MPYSNQLYNASLSRVYFLCVFWGTFICIFAFLVAVLEIEIEEKSNFRPKSKINVSNIYIT